MNLLLLISGNAEKILANLNEDFHTFDIVKIDEKDLSRKSLIINLLKVKKYNKIIFGTLDIEFQRFNFFISIYLILSGYSKGILADNFGNIKKYSLIRFIIIEIPMFTLELFLSSFCILYFYIKFPIIKRLWKSKS
jgi:hypothetical protein